MIARLWFSIVLLTWLGAVSPAKAASVTVAVMEFANTSPEPAWDPLGKGFQEMFLVDLAKASAVQVVPRTELGEKAASLGIVPPAPAAERRRLAKQAGADFLLSGGFSVQGEQMQLDVELLDAGTGKVVLNDVQKGGAEVFFELQKSALKASLGALEIALTPRERAETGRLHTADFLAFQDFSRGLEYFDAERYEAGLRSLREAMQRDAEFSLARITLETYQELIDTIRQKAAAVGVVRAEQERMARLAQAGDAVEVIRKLLAIAAKTGADAQRERLTALYLLSYAYTGEWRREKALRNYYEVEDRFAMARASEQLARRYHTEAVELWPQLPIKVDDDFVRTWPAAETFDADFAKAVTYLWERGIDSANNRRSYLQNNLEYPRQLAAQLRLTLEEEIARFDTHLELAQALPADDWWVKNQREEMVKELRRVLRFDDSTRILEAFASVSENEWALKGFASQIDVNRQFVALLAGAAKRSLTEEWIRQGLEEWGSPSSVLSNGTEHFTGRDLSPAAARLLTQVRDWPRPGFLFIDDVPVWVHQPPFFFHPGPLSDPRRSDSVRYHRNSRDELDGLLFVGGSPLGDLDVGVTFDHRVPYDFWPGSRDDDRDIDDGRPIVAVLVGLVDLDVAEQRDPVTKDDVLTRPMHGYAVWVREGELQIVRTVESERGGYERKVAFDETVLARTSLPSTKDVVRVDVAVRGREVVAKVGRRSVKTKVEAPPVGFVGVQLRGRGFVQVRDVALRAK